MLTALLEPWWVLILEIELLNTEMNSFVATVNIAKIK
jgi:hypothetical protein